MRWLAFRIFNQAADKENRRFAIRESQAVESIPFSGVMAEPNAPDGVLGVLRYRSRPVRVFDLGPSMGLGPCSLPQTVRVLIARQTRTSSAIGIAVQPELEEVSSLDVPGLQIVDLRLLARTGRGGGAG